MEEIISKRKPNEKRFIKDNGNIEIQIFNQNVHYMKDGKYEEIKNELIEKGDFLESSERDTKVIFNKKDASVKYEKENKFLEIKPITFNVDKCNIEINKKDISKIIYTTDSKFNLEYILTFGRIKENIIVNDAIKVDKFEYEINTNLEVKIEDNLLIAFDKDEKVFVFSVPYMSDDIGAECNKVKYKLENKKLYLCIDKKWINDSERKYPIVIDPTLVESGSNVEDTYIYSGDTSDTRYNRSYLIAGVQKINNQDRINRALIKFNLPEISTSDEIVRAELMINGYYETGSGENNYKTLTIHQITNSWSETTANWSNMQNAYNAEAEAVAYLMRSIDDPLNPGYPMYGQSLTPCLITDLVKKWYRDTANNGVMIKQSREEYIDSMTPMLFSSDCGSAFYGPNLIIEYRNCNGILPYMDYSTQSFTNGRTSVNTFAGNLNALFNLVSTIGVFPASLGIVYNTNDVVKNNNTIYGKGYKLTLDETIKNVVIGNDNKLEYEDGTGAIHYFFLNENKYYDEDGLSLEITQVNSNFILKDKLGNVMTFVPNGNTYYLNKIKNLSEHEINITRNSNNEITKVIDENNNEINVTYQTNSIVFTSPSETTTLNYQNNNLSTIVTKEGTTSILYNTNNIITKIIDVTGLYVEFGYYTNEPYKIQTITHYGLNDTEGESVTFEYGNLNTIMTNNKGISTTNIYNYYGNLVSQNILPTNGNINDIYSISRTYGDELNDMNKMLSNTIPIRFTKNYCKLTNWTSLYPISSFSSNMGLSDAVDVNYSGASLVEYDSSYVNQHALTGFDLPNNKTYTISLDARTTLNSKITFYLYNNPSDIIYEKTLNSNNDYEKIYFTFNKPNISNDLIMKISHDSSCSTFVGDITITEGEMLNNCNLIDNPDFSNGIDSWDLDTYSYDMSSPPSPSSVFSVVDIDNYSNKALKVSMDPYYGSKIIKEIDVSGTADDLYYLSFWYKNDGVETSSASGEGSAIGNSVDVLFQPVQGEAEYCVPSFELNSNKGIWQYFSLPFTPRENYIKIIVRLFQGREAGNLYITNFSLYKSLKTNRYNYDEYGNVIEINDIKDINVFEYDKNNELISTTNPRGKNFEIEYDNTFKNRVIRAISSSGISNKLKYDNYGNSIETKISKDYSEEIITGYYKIRQKGTNEYLKIQDNNLTLKEDYCSNTIFMVEKIGDNYKIRDVVIPNKYLTEVNNLIVLSSGGNDMFNIEKNKNGSYHIYLENSNNRKYLKWVTNHFEFVSNYSDIYENYLYEYYLEDSKKLFIKSELAYTADGRFLTAVKDPLLNQTACITNATNGLVTKITNANNIETIYGYNNKELITSITEGNKTVNYSYNNQNLLSEIEQGNKVYEINYDEFLNISNIKINNQNLVANVYEQNNGNILSSTFGNNDVITYQYDNFDRIKKIIKEDKSYEYFYNNNGNVYKLIEGNLGTNYFYDNDNRLTNYIKDNYSIKYSYDNDNNVIERDYNLGSVYHVTNSIFNKEGLVSECSIDTTNLKYYYDDLLRLINKKINNTYETKYEYVSIGNRTSFIIESIQNGNNKYSYKYDKLYNITDVYLNGNLINHYTYDDYNELITVYDYINNFKYEYNYNNEGNIISKVLKNSLNDAIINTDTYEYNNSSWEDLLTKYNNDTITYDSIGNPLTIGINTLTWINGRELASYSNNGLSVTYKYNVNGVRNEKTINGIKTEYFLDGNRIIFEKTGNNIIYYLYNSDDIVGLVNNNNCYYYLKNLQGDIIEILDSNNNLIVKYEYDPFGNVLSIRDSNNQIITDVNNIGIINPFRYRGYYYDKETNLYYLNCRYYNPSWGRFLNSDSIIGNNQSILGQNSFIYTDNNYISKADFNGKFSIAIPFPDLSGILETGKAIAGALGAIGATIASTEVLTVTAIVFGTVVIAQELKDIYSRNNSRTKSDNQDRSHNVYVLLDKDSTIVYGGRTKKLSSAEYRHKHNPERKDLDFYPVASNLTSSEARILEQVLIERCNTLYPAEKGTENRKFNQINGMQKGKRNDFRKIAETWLDENEIPC